MNTSGGGKRSSSKGRSPMAEGIALDELLNAFGSQPEFEPYISLFHFQAHVLPAADVMSVSVILQYEQDRYLTELVGFDYRVVATTGDHIYYDKIAAAMRRLIGRAHAGNHIAGSEDFAQLRELTRAADKAFE